MTISAGDVMSFFNELKRRNVIRVATAYVVTSWLIIQVVETLFPVYGLGDFAIRTVITLLAIAFVPTLIFSWVFEITPEGLKREGDVVREKSIALFTGEKIDRIIMAMLALALGYFAFDKFILDPVEDVQIAESAHQEGRSEALIESYGDKSIAVLPFVNMSADPEQEYFSDGISEELLNLLAKNPGLRVISRSSAFSFKGKAAAITEVAKQLNVAYVLEGSVRKANNQVRITAQLINAHSDLHLWSQTYQRDLTTKNLFAIQTDIAGDISTALDSVLTEGARDQMSRLPTENLDAYYAYHLGRHRMINRTEDSLKQAADLFRQAIELDPGYSLAYVGLADTYMLLGDYGGLDLNTVVANAEPALERALELDPALAPAYATLGAIRTKQFDFPAAESAHQRAIDLDPNYATAYHWYGDLLVTYAYRSGEAIPLLQRALMLDPLSPTVTVTLGQAYEGTGQFEKALDFYHRAIELEPDYPGSYMLLAGISHQAFGRLDEAYRWRSEGLSRNPGQVTALANMGMMLLDLGDAERAEHWIEKALAYGPEHFSAIRARTFLCRYFGQEQDAVESARKLFGMIPGNNATVATLVAFGHFEEALQTYAVSNPELTCNDRVEVTPGTALQALNLSLAFEKTAQQECSDQLLVQALEQLQTLPRLGSFGYGIADVEVYARQGNTALALSTLRSAIDNHWRASWWAQGLTSPHMENLKDHPEFVAMMSEIETDMASQLEKIRALEQPRSEEIY